MVSPISAASAYAKLARLADPGANLGKASDSSGPDFGQMVKQAIGSVVEAGKKSDAQSQAMAAGKANIVDVVTAVVISLFQALTQIQEMTLVFVPKILAIFVAMLVALPFMGDVLQGHMTRLAARIIGG